MSDQVTDQQVTVSGHFGEWLQGRLGPEGPVVLVTLRCDVLTVRAPGRGVRLADLFGAARLDRFCAALGVSLGALPEVTCDIPLGAGAGASTACLLAVARAAGYRGTAGDVARLCIALEGASDPLMFDDPDQVLWASREGRRIAEVPAPPLCEVVGGFWGAPQRTKAADTEFPDVAELFEDWRMAVTRQDLDAVAKVASASARRCTALRGPADPLADLVRDTGALGHVRAHTGSARGLVFAPGQVPEAAEHMLREAGLRDILRFRTGGMV